MARYRRWSKEEDEILKTGLKQGRIVYDIAQDLPRRSHYATRERLRRLGLQRPARKLWSKKEMRRLEELYLNTEMSPQDIATDLGRTLSSIQTKVSTLGLLRKLPWTSEDEALLVELYSTNEGIDVIAKQLGRSQYSIETKAYNLKLYRTHSRVDPYLLSWKISNNQARAYFEEHQIPIIKEGHGKSSYDFIVRLEGKPIAVNVKFTRTGQFNFTITNLRRMQALKVPAYLLALDTHGAVFWLKLVTVDG